MGNDENLLQRLTELEMKSAFQEKLLEELNQVIVEQQFALDKIQLQLRYVVGKLKDIQPSNIALASEETPPPHY